MGQYGSLVGLRDVVIAPLTADTTGTDGAATYGTVVPLVGAIDIQIDDQGGDEDVQYYDDNEGDVLYPDPELKCTMEMADIPLDKLATILGHTVDQYGVMVRKDGDKAGYFAMGFKSKKGGGGDVDRYVWLLKGRAKLTTQQYQTKKGKEITRQTTKLEWTFIKRNHDAQYQYMVDSDDEDFATKKASFFTSVYTPTFTTSGGGSSGSGG